MKIVITGGPNTGKTAYVPRHPELAAYPVKHTDDLQRSIGDWSKESEAVSTWFDIPGDWVVEGTTVARALRKWLKRNPTGKPCDRLIYLARVYGNRTPGQNAMAKGIVTVLKEILPELRARGVECVVDRGDV